MRPIIKSISPASISIPGQSMAMANAEMDRLRLQARIAASGGGSSGGTITYDYLITNDAEWATVFGLGAATLSGKTIAVAPGNYTSKTISSFNPAATVRVISSSASSKPQIDMLTINGSGNIAFENMRIVSSVWSAGNNSCLTYTGTVGAMSFTRCDFVGNYRGVVGDPSFSTTAAYPEYANIQPVFNGSGVVTGYTIPQPLVGDLLADGTYDMVFNDASGIVFTVNPTAQFTVSGGQIVSTTPGTGGSSNGLPSTGAGILSNLITWTGQRQMKSWMPRMWRTSSGTATGAQTFIDCTTDLVSDGYKPQVSGPVTIDRCTMDRVYQDFFSFSNATSLTIRDCFGTRPFSSNDAGDPHSDFIQLFLVGQSVNWQNITLERNIFMRGVARGNVQGLFISDATLGFYYDNVRIVGNCVASDGYINGMSLDNPRDGFIFANAFIRWDPSDVASNPSSYALNTAGNTSPAGDVIFGRNIAETVVGSSSTVDSSTFANSALGLRGATISYTDMFANHTGPRTTVAQVVAAYAPKPAYAGQGPFGNTAYIDHVNRTTNLTLEPSIVRFTPIGSQSTSTLVTSEWSRIQGGPLTGNTISVTGGEYRIADDASGTGATAWTTAPGTYARDKFLQLRHTTSASGSTDTTTTVTLRGSFAYTFVSTTASILSFVMADNQGTARSSFSTATMTGETGIRKVVIACRARPDAITANANIFATTGAASQRFWFPTTGAFRYQFANSTTVNLRPSLTPTTDAKTHIITLDFTQATGTGCYWATIEDGLLLNNTHGSGGTMNTSGGAATFSANGTNQMFGTDTLLGLFSQAGGAGTLFDGAIGFFWMDWGGSSYTIPDITQSSVRNKWLADLIGVNGEGPTGSTPKLYYTGNVTAWNAGITNLGSLTSRPLNKDAGTYV